MLNEKDLREAMAVGLRKQKETRAKYEKSKKETEKLALELASIEADIRICNDRLEDELSARGEWCDQFAFDFTVEKYARNRRIIRNEHQAIYTVCEADVQCASCLKHTVVWQYYRDKRLIEGTYPTYGWKMVHGIVRKGLQYCEGCMEAGKC